MKRAVIYARYSSDKQNAKSCTDQISLCQQWAKNNNISVVETYQDDAISGSSMLNRFGLASLMHDAKSGKFDVVICEALDRLSRDQADLASIRKDLNFQDIGIFTIQDGEVGIVQVGIKGLMGELYLQDLAQKTRRGNAAVVKDGRNPGGKSYGYDIVQGKKGELKINEGQAKIIRRIFDEYISGKTPRQIALGLNTDGIPGPRGGEWRQSAINGSAKRQDGILRNQLYVGVRLWNKLTYRKNPSTGRRVSRLNSKTELTTIEVPDLRILSDHTFNQATAILAAKSVKRPRDSKKPTHLLSGLTKCSHCGSTYTIYGKDRLRCGNRAEGGSCDNKRTIARAEVEERVLSALKEELANPQYISEYVHEYQAERKRLMAQQRSAFTIKIKRLSELERGINNLVDMIVNGTASEAVKARLDDMELEQKKLQAELALADDNNVVELHPNAADKYKRIVEDLQASLANLPDDGKDAVFAEVRKLIEKIDIIPQGQKKNDPIDIEVHGILSQLLNISSSTLQESRGKVVAGARFELTTFRL